MLNVVFCQVIVFVLCLVYGLVLIERFSTLSKHSKRFMQLIHSHSLTLLEVVLPQLNVTDCFGSPIGINDVGTVK